MKYSSGGGLTLLRYDDNLRLGSRTAFLCIPWELGGQCMTELGLACPLTEFRAYGRVLDEQIQTNSGLAHFSDALNIARFLNGPSSSWHPAVARRLPLPHRNLLLRTLPHKLVQAQVLPCGFPHLLSRSLYSESGMLIWNDIVLVLWIYRSMLRGYVDILKG